MKKVILDPYEQEIEDNLEKAMPIQDEESERALLENAAKKHASRKKSVTIRINELDLEAVKLKAAKLGVPYQTYINILIHRDAISL